MSCDAEIEKDKCYELMDKEIDGLINEAFSIVEYHYGAAGREIGEEIINIAAKYPEFDVMSKFMNAMSNMNSSPYEVYKEIS